MIAIAAAEYEYESGCTGLERCYLAVSTLETIRFP
jgi:hypothetical protein